MAKVFTAKHKRREKWLCRCPNKATVCLSFLSRQECFSNYLCMGLLKVLILPFLVLWCDRLVPPSRNQNKLLPTDTRQPQPVRGYGIFGARRQERISRMESWLSTHVGLQEVTGKAFLESYQKLNSWTPTVKKKDLRHPKILALFQDAEVLGFRETFQVKSSFSLPHRNSLSFW